MNNYIYLVTVTFNDDINLSKTFDSIRRYKKPYHKYIVIDGESKDSSLSLIHSNKDIIDFSISEPDRGIYDAMNKALLFDMKGDDLILWLNSGDLLIDWSKNQVQQYFDYDCIFGCVFAKLNDNFNHHLISPKIVVPYTERHFFPKSTFMHQGFLIKRKVFDTLSYDLKIGLQAENLLMSKCIQRGNFFITEDVLSIFYLDGISNRDFKSLLKSYLNVAKNLQFSKVKVLYFQFPFIIKTVVKIILPNKLFNLVRKK